MDFASTPLEEPFARSGKPYLIVLLSGLFTSALTLAGVYWLARNVDDFFIMGWYAYFVIPIGAIIVGLAAASGYALASWLSGTRVSRGLLLAVLLLQTGAYFTAEYVEYLVVLDDLRNQGMQAGQEPSFAQFYDFKARSFGWAKQGAGNQPVQPMGAWGYLFVSLGAAGFILSGLMAPAMLYSVPYCERCQRYMKTKLLGVLPASLPDKKIAKKDLAGQEAFAQEQEQAATNAVEALARLQTALEEHNSEAFQQELAAAGAIKANEKLPRRIHVSFVWCTCCLEGKMSLRMASGSGESARVDPLSEHPVPATFVRGLFETPAAIYQAGGSKARAE